MGRWMREEEGVFRISLLRSVSFGVDLCRSVSLSVFLLFFYLFSCLVDGEMMWIFLLFSRFFFTFPSS